MTALRECPFCGSDEAGFGKHSGSGGYFVCCADCLASTGSLMPHGLSESEAAEVWNKRADDRYTITPLGAAMLEGKKNG